MNSERSRNPSPPTDCRAALSGGRFGCDESPALAVAISRRRALRWIGAVGWAAGLVGCQTDNSSRREVPLTVLTFPGRTRDEVGMAVLDVFTRAGFEARKVEPAQMEFLRRSSKVDDVLYGGLMSGDVWERVRVKLSAPSDTEARLELIAHKVQAPGDQVFEEARRIRSASRYNQELDAIRNRLKPQ